MSHNLLEFDKKEGEVNISPFLVEIKEFRDILKGKKKDDKIKILSYIFHISNPLSPYSQYTDETRKEKLIESILEGDKKLANSKKMNYAIDKYKELMENNVTRAIEAAHSALRKIRNFFNDVDFSERTNSGAAVYKPKEILQTTGQLNQAAKDLDELENKLKKQQEDESLIKGDVKLNEFNKG